MMITTMTKRMLQYNPIIQSKPLNSFTDSSINTHPKYGTHMSFVCSWIDHSIWHPTNLSSGLNLINYEALKMVPS